MFTFFPTLLSIVLIAGIACADTVTFKDGINGYTGTDMTWIKSNRIYQNQGANVNAFSILGQHTTLIRFTDMFGAGNPIPFGSTITSANMYIKRKYFYNNNSTERVFHLIIRDWIEGTGNDANLGEDHTGGVTWDNWNAAGIGANGGAQGSEWIDDPALNAYFNPVADATYYAADITVAMQAWSDGTDNFGLAMFPLVENPYNQYFHTDDADFADRPYLEVTFIPVATSAIPEPGSLLLVLLALAGLIKRWIMR